MPILYDVLPLPAGDVDIQSISLPINKCITDIARRHIIYLLFRPLYLT